jgi:hypothetical protein
MTPTNLALVAAFVCLPLLGFVYFRLSSRARQSLAISRLASILGIGFFGLWLIATMALSIALFSQVTAGPRV